MERLSKVAVTASNILALWLLARLVSRGVPPILIPTALALLLGCGAAVLFGNLAVSAVLAVTYFVPALLFAWLGMYSYSSAAIWIAALCGAMLPAGIRGEWAFPPRWKSPLVFWALAIALSWPLVTLREVDFVPALIDVGNIHNSRLGASPPIVAIWTLSVASISMTGLLLFDWLLLAYPRDQLKAFESRIIWPMLAGAVMAALVATYQALVDLSFMNLTLFGSIGRAVGTMRDANVLGASMAMWLPVAAAMALASRRARGWLAPLVAAVAVLAVAVWASGSRTALLAAVSGLCVMLAASRRHLTLRRAAIGLALLIVAGGGFAVLLPRFVAAGPWARLFVFVTEPVSPGFSMAGLMLTIHHLWSRGMYGTAAVQMIREHPLVGIGIGGFNYMYADILYLIDGTILPPDNAQNWFRQEMAELGVLGSLGWIVWTAMLVWVVVRRRGPDDRRLSVGAAKGAVVGLGLASLLGMPTIDVIPSITFVVIACWCLKLTAVDEPAPVRKAAWSRFEWPLVTTLLLLFLAGTAYAARTDLRPPVRAMRADFLYQYGFGAADEQDPAFRWTAAHAVDVFRAEGRWLKMTIGAVAPDAAERPVRVSVWYNNQLILRVDRRGNFPITKYIRLPKYGTLVMLEFDVSRTWNGRGVAVTKWEFMDPDPPKGSLTVE